MRVLVLTGALLALCCSDNGGSGADASLPIDADPADAFPPPVCPGGSSVSFSNDVVPIFEAKCGDNQCHDSRGSAAGLDLTPANAFAALVGASAERCDRPLVTPGDIDGSYLVNKLTGLDMCRGSLMPKASERLEPAELDTILRWICDGAVDD